MFTDDPQKAGVNNLLEIYEAVTGQARTAIEAHFQGRGYAALKEEVAGVLIEGLRPIREGYRELMSDPAGLDGILADGADRARSVAEPKLQDIKRKIGFTLPSSDVGQLPQAAGLSSRLE
jgi:tryptophanyl-tRNA synthetase